jgi:hypothetical protein
VISDKEFPLFGNRLHWGLQKDKGNRGELVSVYCPLTLLQILPQIDRITESVELMEDSSLLCQRTMKVKDFSLTIFLEIAISVKLTLIQFHFNQI